MANYKDAGRELAIVTAGVLIALLINSLVEWNHYRLLVKEAHATIAREMADNKREIDISLASIDKNLLEFDNAVVFADDMIRAGKSAINQVKLGLELAELSAAAWQSAAGTGALAHMQYAEVQQLSKVYGMQELVASQQRQALEHLTQASGLLRLGDPTRNIATKDFEAFRAHVLTLRADAAMLKEFSQRLAKNYQERLNQPAR